MVNRTLKLIAAMLLGPVAAFGQSDALQMRGNILSIVNPAPTPGVTKLVSPGTGGYEFWVNGSQVANVTAAGLAFPTPGTGVRPAIYVPTFAATPAAGTNDLKVGFNAVPTAAADTAACLPSVPNVGDVVEGRNTMGNAVRVKACGTPGINGAAAGTYIPLAAAAYFRCVASSATAWNCGTLAVPTPAGP